MWIHLRLGELQVRREALIEVNSFRTQRTTGEMRVDSFGTQRTTGKMRVAG